MAKKEALFFCLLISIYLYFFMVTKSYYDEGLKLPTTTTGHQQKQAVELANTKAGLQQDASVQRPLGSAMDLSGLDVAEVEPGPGMPETKIHSRQNSEHPLSDPAAILR